jgi:hypothetical protein
MQLTEARVKSICVKVRQGVPQGPAAGSVGIPRRTLQNWLAIGREAGAPEPYASFADRLQEALDTFHASRAVIVGESMDDRTALQVLERRFKDDWADTKSGTVVNLNVAAERSESVGEVLGAAKRVLTSEDFLRLVDELAGPDVVDAAVVEHAELAAA